MDKKEMEKRIEDLEKQVEALHKAIANIPHPAVINSLVQQNQSGSILDGLF